MSQLRQPIITVLGHVDSGKTTLLDKIRQTAIAQKEAGLITQAIGTTAIPLETIHSVSGKLLERFKFEITVPGLLFIDTPGHEAFSTLRKRGGSIADIAVLVVDIAEGIMPQTIESIGILKDTKTPFVIAINKIDRVQGWLSGSDSFLENYHQQRDSVASDFENQFYHVVNQFSQRGLTADRFDRVTDFTKAIAAVPTSGRTGEGIPELLTVLVGLAQQFLSERLTVSEKASGIILEVKDYTGLGMTIDTIVYDGTVRKNDFLVIGGRNAKITRIRALLMPEPLRDIRTERKFTSVDAVTAAAGVKIAAPELGDAVAGSELRTTASEEEAQQLLDEMRQQLQHTEIMTDHEGLILKADTIGSLEALISVFKDYPVREATIGQITKSDVMKAEANRDEFHRAVIGFNARANEETEQMARDKDVALFSSDIIYTLGEEYAKWVAQQQARIQKEELAAVTHAGKIRLLPGYVFRASNPAVVGCEVLGGFIKAGCQLLKNNREIGEIKQIQVQGETVAEATIGQQVAVSIAGPTVGRQIDEADVLYTELTESNYRLLMSRKELLTEHEKSVLQEIVDMKRKENPRWGL